MPTITLPDGQKKHIDQEMNLYAFAHGISPRLAKDALYAIMDGHEVDLGTVLSNDCSVEFITDKDSAGLQVLRHSTAHLLAHAVKTLFPSAQVTIGPVINDGFYYDFAFERAFTPEDLISIEKRMHDIAAENITIVRRELQRDQALEYFSSLGEDYKVKIIQDIPDNQVLSLYKQGEFEDLCRGPHVPSTGRVKSFKLTKIAGAYWRGDAKNPMLQRIYGTAFADKKALEQHLFQLEEAEKRDHRKLGKSLDLFHFQDIAPGMVFWHPKGFAIYQVLEKYMRKRLSIFGYQEIRTPQLVDRVLWEKSGHWENFRDDMFEI